MWQTLCNELKRDRIESLLNEWQNIPKIVAEKSQFPFNIFTQEQKQKVVTWKQIRKYFDSQNWLQSSLIWNAKHLKNSESFQLDADNGSYSDAVNQLSSYWTWFDFGPTFLVANEFAFSWIWSRVFQQMWNISLDRIKSNLADSQILLLASFEWERTI